MHKFRFGTHEIIKDDKILSIRINKLDNTIAEKILLSKVEINDLMQSEIRFTNKFLAITTTIILSACFIFFLLYQIFIHEDLLVSLLFFILISSVTSLIFIIPIKISEWKYTFIYLESLDHLQNIRLFYRKRGKLIEQYRKMVNPKFIIDRKTHYSYDRDIEPDWVLMIQTNGETIMKITDKEHSLLKFQPIQELVEFLSDYEVELSAKAESRRKFLTK